MVWRRKAGYPADRSGNIEQPPSHNGRPDAAGALGVHTPGRRPWDIPVPRRRKDAAAGLIYRDILICWRWRPNAAADERKGPPSIVRVSQFSLYALAIRSACVSSAPDSILFISPVSLCSNSSAAISSAVAGHFRTPAAASPEKLGRDGHRYVDTLLLVRSTHQIGRERSQAHRWGIRRPPDRLRALSHRRY